MFNYKDKIDSQSNFNKVLLAIMAKRKVIDMYRRNKNSDPIGIDDTSMDSHTISE